MFFNLPTKISSQVDKLKAQKEELCKQQDQIKKSEDEVLLVYFYMSYFLTSIIEL